MTDSTVPSTPSTPSAKAGDFKVVKDKKIFLASGYAMKKAGPNFYSPKNAEEKDLCAYFESIGILKAVK